MALPFLLHCIPTPVEAGGLRFLVIAALLIQLNFRQAGRRLGRVVTGLADSPAVAFIAVGCLLLLTLTLPGIDECLFRGRR